MAKRKFSFDFGVPKTFKFKGERFPAPAKRVDDSNMTKRRSTPSSNRRPVQSRRRDADRRSNFKPRSRRRQANRNRMVGREFF